MVSCMQLLSDAIADRMRWNIKVDYLSLLSNFSGLLFRWYYGNRSKYWEAPFHGVHDMQIVADEGIH